MVAVIADDFTGAAELGGLGLRYNLRVEVVTAVPKETAADLLVVATETRSKTRAEAVAEMAAVTLALSQLQPRLIFKKVDSVLRGHLLAEINAQLMVLGLPRAVIVPANPALGRTLSNGTYLLHGQPIHLSSFANDPEFAISSSWVLDMVGASVTPVQVLKNQEALPETGVIIGEAQSSADLTAWAHRLDRQTLAAGAAGFFSAVLEPLAFSPAARPAATLKHFGQPALYVCGSSFRKSQEVVLTEKSRGGPVSYMPSALFRGREALEEQYEGWCEEIFSFLTTRGKAIVAIDPAFAEDAMADARQLREKTAKVVSMVFERARVHELLLEGGSTASSVLRHLGITNFQPVREHAPGVIRMRVAGHPDLCLTVKPGSYDWPAEVWAFDPVLIQ
jgi:D-threonate/D-erythronate kinase